MNNISHRNEMSELGRKSEGILDDIISASASSHSVGSVISSALETASSSSPCLDEENNGVAPLVKDNPPRKGNDEGSRVPPASSTSSSSSHFLPMGDCYAVDGSEAPVRDKSDNRQTHEVSDCPQKSAAVVGGEDSEGFTIFKPSSKIIELPEKKAPPSTTKSPSNENHHHHPHHQHNHHHHTSHFRKESKIPVGIAVAWQRLVTSTTTTPTVTSAIMTSKSEGNPLKANSHPSRPSSASPHHQVSKGKSGSGKYNHSHHHHHSTSSSQYANGGGGGGGASAKNGFGDSDISSRPLSACGDPGGGGGGGSPFCPTSPLARPFPSSSVPPNLGYPYNQYQQQQQVHHHLHRIPPQSPYFADFGSVSSYPTARQSPFAVPSPLQSPSSPHHHQHHHHPHFLQQSPYWTMQSPIENNPNVPLLSPGMGGGGGAGGDYLQQLSMQQQLVVQQQQHEHLLSRHVSLSSSHHSLPGSPSPGGSPSPYHPHPYLGFMYPAQEKMSPQAAAYYDHYFQQQQQQHQSELLRQQQQQQQQLSVVNGSSSSRSSSSSSGFESSSSTQRAIPMEQGRGEGIPVLSPGQIRAPAALAHACTVVSSNSSSSASSLQVQTPPSSLPAASSQATSTPENNNGGGGMILSQTSSCSSSPSPSFLLHQQQQHPHLFTSSTAALSPKSLTSSTPSPVTVHDFNSGLNVVIGSSSSSQGTMLTSASQLRKTTTPSPSPISLTPRALLSPFGFSPSPVPMFSSGGGEKVVVGGSGKKGVPTPLSSPSQRHDFKRLESLIERRDCESISPLVLIPQHSPAASTTSSSGGGEKLAGDDDKLSLLNFPVKLETDVEDESRKVDDENCEEKCVEVKGEEEEEEVKEEEESGPMSDQSKGFSCDDNANEVVVGGEAVSPVSEQCPNTPRDQPSEIDERNRVPESNTLPSTESSSDYFPSFSSFKRDTTNHEESEMIPEKTTTTKKKNPTGANSPKTKVAPPSFKVRKAKEKKVKPKKAKGGEETMKAKKKDTSTKRKRFEEKLPAKPRKNNVKIQEAPVVTPPDQKKTKKSKKKMEDKAPLELKGTKGKKKEASDKGKGGKGKKDKTVEGVVVKLKKEKKSKKIAAPETSLEQQCMRQGTGGATNNKYHHPLFPPSSMGEGVASESDIRISERVLLQSTQPPPQQVTFLLAPESIRIPAYVPRSSVAENTSAASFHLGEDVVGADEQTLTLHRDVEQVPGAVHFPQQPPPAITIQYHHSAPATPATGFESPPFEYSLKPEENHLNLLATVAQEFGSREDLGSGKLLSSIDGSCNSSVIGESPPMSPQKSPFSSYIHHHHHRPIINQVPGPPTGPSEQQQQQLVLPPIVQQKTPGTKGKSSKVGKGKKEEQRTANSITINGKVGVVRKAGKKEKRSASDSASYSPPSVVLKIPQILPSSRRLLPAEKERKKRKRKDKEQATPDEVKVRRIKNKGGIENESETDKKKKNKGRKSEENKKKGESKGKGKARLLSPLKLQIGSADGEPTTPSKSPGGSSCFYNPPERISAFAKQVIARRDSSPTKPPGSGSSDTSPLKCSSQSAFFPTTTASPPRMPRLIPYDDDEEQVPKVKVGGAVPPQHDGIMEATSPEQDWTKTEFLDRSRIDRSKLNGNTIPEKKKGSSSSELKEKKRPKPLTLLKPPDEKLKKVRKERLVSIDERIRKKKKERLEKSLSILSASLPQSEVEVESAVPLPSVKVTSPRVTPSSGSEGKLLSSSFSPLTPPPTAKTMITSDDGMSGRSQTLPNRGGPLSPGGTETSRHSTPITVVDVETENEAEIDLANVWVADPLFAASAIKISSNQPSENEHGHHSDSSIFIVSDKEEEASGGKPPKLTLMTSQSNDRVGEEEDDDDDHNRKFLEVKSQLKAFVHFKPKQLTSNKANSHHHIKPCLKADPVVREEDNEEDELLQVDDEDFELDMEVAKLTTPSMKLPPSPRKKGKKTINRNSSSYSSSRKEKISTKDIMTKVFSRKLSPDLSSPQKKTKRRRSSAKKPRSRHTSPATASQEMEDADDEGGEEEEEDELLDIHSHHHPRKSQNPEVAMSAAAAAVVVNSSSSSSVLASPEQRMMARKSPKKRSARSSTTSSCTSVKSTRGNRGQILPPSATSSSSSSGQDETLTPGKVELDSVAELVDEMRILTDIQGLFYTGRLKALQPPDVYGVTLDNERGAPPHLIFSAEEVLEKCLREKKPHSLSPGMRISAYWSPQYSGLYPGRVSSEGFNPKFDPEQDLIPIEFDDGDTGMIKLKEIRLLSTNHPVREYDPNPLLTLEKKHRKRRHSSATGTSGGCTGDHEEDDCGEPYCAKVGKLEEDEDDEDDDDADVNGLFGSTRGSGSSIRSGSKMLYWTWSGLSYKRPKSKKNRNKEFFHGIQRGDEVLNVGDSALFISTGNERPFIGRVERFWEQKGKKMVNVRWFYHPEEVQASAKRLSNLKYPGALFESPHIDENDVQTIARKCDVLPFPDFRQRLLATSSGSPRLAKLSQKSSSKPRDMYYVAGFYDPYTYNLTLKDLK